MSERNLTILTLGVIGLVAVGVGTMLFFDLQAMGKVDRRIEATQKRIDGADEKLGEQLRVLIRNLRNASDESRRMAAQVPVHASPRRVIEAIHEIEDTVNQEPGARISVNTDGVFKEVEIDLTAEEQPDFFDLDVELTMYGNYLGFVRFIEGIEEETDRPEGGRLFSVIGFSSEPVEDERAQQEIPDADRRFRLLIRMYFRSPPLRIEK